MKAMLLDVRKIDCDITALPNGKAFCNITGVVYCGKQPKKSLSEKQVQANLLGHTKYFTENT